jgi:hypothetical protein
MLVLPQLSQKFDIGLALLTVLCHKLAPDIIYQRVIRAAVLKLLEFSIVLKINDPQCFQNFAHHSLNGGGVRVMVCVRLADPA